MAKAGYNVTDDDVVSPVLYSDETAFHAMLAAIRANDPVRWTEPTDYRPFWALTKHADILEVERRADIFLAGPRNRLLTIAEEDRIRAITGGGPLMRSLPTMDDPDHAKYRVLTQSWFRPANLRRLEERIDGIIDDYIAVLRATGGECDFAKEISVWIPLRVIMLILGVPDADAEMMHRLTGQLFSPHDPDLARQGDKHATAAAGAEFFAYFQALLQRRRAEPTDDLLSVIANATIDDGPIGDKEALAYCVSITAAGHDTTASSIAGGLHALCERPEQYARLHADPTLVGRATEEMLRFVSPVRSFMRTATEDYELRGQVIRTGQAVLTLYPSANRDEDVFERPNDFMIDRTPNKHIAFGTGPHMCLGMLLARMEINRFYERLVKQVSTVELTAPATWYQANFLGGPKSLPVKCSFH